MTRLLVLAGVFLWVGVALLLGEWRRLRRPRLLDRLRLYSPAAAPHAKQGGLFSVESVGELVGPLARQVGDAVASLFGVSESIEHRLLRTHSPLDVTRYRVRQVGWSTAAGVTGLIIAASGVSPVLAALLVAGGPLLVFLVIEQRLSSASSRWQRRVERELPVITEQMAMLLNAGFSLGAALNRLAARGAGCCATDLSVVSNRLRQGVPEVKALREWSDVAGVEGVERLVSVLTLNAGAVDLGRLVGHEAREQRKHLQRQDVELLERRAQQVWVPVTVATLIPGVILLAIPFLSALRIFSNA